MNSSYLALNALVSMSVCPKHNGASECCTKCPHTSRTDCYTTLHEHCAKILNEYATQYDVLSEAASVYKCTIEDLVQDVLQDVGVPCHTIGYKYIKRALLLVLDDPTYIDRITYGLYSTLAKEFTTTGSRVERGIRHAIEIAVNRADPEVLQKYFGNTIDQNRGKPTNGEFIATMTEHVRRLYRSM